MSNLVPSEPFVSSSDAPFHPLSFIANQLPFIFIGEHSTIQPTEPGDARPTALFASDRQSFYRFPNGDDATTSEEAGKAEYCLLGIDIPNKSFGEINGQYPADLWVGRRYIGDKDGNEIEPNQLLFNLLDSESIFSECTSILGTSQTLWLYIAAITGIVENDINEEGSLTIWNENVGTGPPGEPNPQKKAELNKTIVNAKNPAARARFINDYIRPYIEAWFEHINWNNTARINAGVDPELTKKYPKVSLLNYEEFLKNEDNWQNTIPENFIKLFAGAKPNYWTGQPTEPVDSSAAASIGGGGGGPIIQRTVFGRLRELYQLGKGVPVPIDTRTRGASTSIDQSPNVFNALVEPNWKVDVNILDYLGFQETIDHIDQTADSDGDGIIDATELAAELNGPGSDFLERAMGLFSQVGGYALSEEDRRAGNQCALMSGLLYGDGSWRKYWLIEDPNAPEAQENKRISPLGNPEKGGNRIYPVSPDKGNIGPRDFANFCEAERGVNFRMKDLAEDQVADIKEYDYMKKELWWVYEDEGVLRETKLKLTSETLNDEGIGTTEYSKYDDALRIYYTEENAQTKANRLRDLLGEGADISEAALLSKLSNLAPTVKNDKDFFSLNNIKITYKGGTPATAKSDVSVDFSFTLSSLQALTDISINQDDTIFVDGKREKLDIKLYNLITLPNFGTVQSGIGSKLKNQYHPDYSRVRLKVFPAAKKEGAIIIDLCTVDHSLDRSGDIGNVQMTISMKGYYESLAGMPEHDILCDAKDREKRLELKKLIDTYEEQNCPQEMIQEIKREQKRIYADTKRNYSAISNRLSELKCIHGYSYKKSLVTNIIRGRSFIDGSYIDKFLPNGGGQSGYQSFFFLGDLIYVMLDAIFEPDSDEFLETAKTLNTRLIVACIQVPLFNPIRFETINPLCIPVDLEYFKQWYTVNITNRGIETMSVDIFLKLLIEKFVNNVLMETCFSGYADSFPTPEICAHHRFTTDDEWFEKDSEQFLVASHPYNPLMAQFESAGPNTLFRKNAYYGSNSSLLTRELKGRNYFVVYPRYSLPITSVTERNVDNNNEMLKNSTYCPTIFYGRNNEKYNFISNLKLSKQNVPHLRESRFSSADFGNLSLLAGVYDLSFSFVDTAANTYFFPGMQINLVLLDWDAGGVGASNPYNIVSRGDWDQLGENNPHRAYTLANITGLGGYFCILDVTYSIGLDDQDFTINISAKFSGSDATTELRGKDYRRTLIDSETICGAPVANAEEINEGEETDPTNPEETVEDPTTPDEPPNAEVVVEVVPRQNRRTGITEELLSRAGIPGTFKQTGKGNYKPVEGRRPINLAPMVTAHFSAVADGTQFVMEQPADLTDPNGATIFVLYTYNNKSGTKTLTGIEVQ